MGSTELIQAPFDRSARRVGAGLAALALLAVLVSGVSLYALQSVVSSSEAFVDARALDLVEAERLRALSERSARLARGFLLTGDERQLSERPLVEEDFRAAVRRARTWIESGEGRRLLAAIVDAHRRYEEEIERAIALRRQGRSPEQIGALFERRVLPVNHELSEALDSFAAHKRRRFRDGAARSARQERRALLLLLAGGVSSLLATLGLGLLLRRTLHLLGGSQRELARALERSELVNRDLDAFAGRIAHDVRGALTVIAIGAELLPRQAGDAQGIERTCARIRRGIDQATVLTDGLLAFSRAGRPAEPPEVGSLRGAVRATLEQLGPLAERAGATIELTGADAQVRCPEGLLRVIATNLVGNAVKYLEGRPARHVDVRISATAAWGILEVADTGPGIPAVARARIFEPFYRAPGATAPGSGLGLATVERIVRGHGGRIEVESQEQQGSLFRVLLPAAPDAPAAPPLDRPPATDSEDARPA